METRDGIVASLPPVPLFCPELQLVARMHAQLLVRTAQALAFLSGPFCFFF